MAIDKAEAAKRGITRNKTSTKHPYAAIEHRVIDSAAYSDLTATASKVLLLLARQITMGKDGRLNNGHLQATFSFMKMYGIGSEHTLQSAIEQLISHGLIYRTRSHGANKVCARYALTWHPIQKKEGLFLDGFKSCAWQHWEPEKKTPGKKRRTLPAQSAVSPTAALHLVQEVPQQNLQTMN